MKKGTRPDWTCSKTDRRVPAARSETTLYVRTRATMGLFSKPELAVAREVGSILLDFVRLAWRMPAYWFELDGLRQRLRQDLELEAPAPVELERAIVWPDRPLRLFVSWAEPSGEIHATRLIEVLRERARAAGAPEPEFRALGSHRGDELDVQMVGYPAERAFMGLFVGFGPLGYYLRLVRDVVRVFRTWQPDVFIPVDSPSLHVPLGRLARGQGVPVVHFVTPQYWGWAPWRVHGYRAAVTRALTILPFEPAWFRRRDVPVAHVGHPLLDALGDVTRTTPPAASRLIAILPGSRRSIVRRNLPWMLDRFAELQRARPELEAAVVAASDELAEIAASAITERGLAQVAVRRELHPTLASARAALSVSGTVLLDVLHHRLPTVVVYRLAKKREERLGPAVLIPPYFASVNLLAAREVWPEFFFAGEGPVRTVLDCLERCVYDEETRRDCAAGLAVAARKLGPPGAVGRAADQALDVALPAHRAP